MVGFRPSRRWLQFSLRTLLIVMTLTGATLGWIASERQKAAKQQEAVEGFQAEERLWASGINETDLTTGAKAIHASAEITFDPRATPRPEWLRLVLGNETFGTAQKIKFSSADDTGLAPVVHLTNTREIYLYGTSVGDAGMHYLASLPKLEVLLLGGTRVGDAGVTRLEKATSLKMLFLTNTRTGDVGLAHLSKLPSLENLYLSDTLISDAGLQHLSRLEKLKELELKNTNVTDAGLVHLRTLGRLSKLDLRDTKVTDVGVRELKKALPDLWIGR